MELDYEELIATRKLNGVGDKLFKRQVMSMKERQDLIKSHEEYNKKGEKNLKYIISLSIDDDYFKMMQPKIFRAK